MVLEDLSFLFSLRPFLLVELMKIFSVLQNLSQEFSMACFLATFLARAHGKLESVKSPSFALKLHESLCSSVEIAV